MKLATVSRYRRQIGTKFCGKRAVGFFSIFQALTISVLFSRSWDRFVSWRKNLQTTDGRCDQYTLKHSTYRVAHHALTMNRATTRGSRSHIMIASLQSVIHVSCLICFCLFPLPYCHRLQKGHPRHFWSTIIIGILRTIIVRGSLTMSRFHEDSHSCCQHERLCGEAEDVVRVLTLVCRGVAQEEDRQEES